MALKCNLFWSPDNTCVAFLSDNVKGIQKKLNEGFANICDRFVDIKVNN